MEELIEKIGTLTEPQLQLIMQAIQQRYAQTHPEIDILYLALHKDPLLRRKELTAALDLILSCTEQHLDQLH